MVEITQEDWAIWKADKVTQRFMEVILNHREEALRVLAQGHISSFAKQNIMIGAINAYTNVLDVQYDGDQ